MYDLSNRDLDEIDNELERYRTIANKIYLRRQELIHNKKHGNETYIRSQGKKVSSPTEDTIIRIEEDLTLRYLEGFKLIVDTLMENLIDTDLVIFKMRFLEAGVTWEEVAENLNKTTRYINSRRKVIAKRFIELKGYWLPPLWKKFFEYFGNRWRELFPSRRPPDKKGVKTDQFTRKMISFEWQYIYCRGEIDKTWFIAGR